MGKRMIKSKTGLWSAFSKAIRKSQANHQGFAICPSCGKQVPWEETDCGHFIENTERKKDWGGNALWYDKRNFGAQCWNCNRFDAARAKRDWTERFVSQHGEDLYKELKELYYTPKKWTPEEVNAIIDEINA